MAIDVNLIPLGIYVHIPWCVEKCPYCDFNSHKLREEKPPEEEYVKVISHHLKQYANMVGNRPVSTVFFGGGTPSIMSGKAIANIINIINKNYNTTNDIEITLEANPGTVDQSRFKSFLEAGVNRLSIGVQSFDDKMLKILGRIHDSNTAKKAIDAAQEAGFNNINLDLMYALPGQTHELSTNDLKIALSFQTPHLSWYQLTLEPNTVFYNKPPRLPESEVIEDIENEGYEILKKYGMNQYEISAWSKNYKNKCRHNYNIWQFGDYIGVGAGACGKITLEHNIIRTMQTKHPKQYLKQTHKVNDKIVKREDLAFEFMLNHLRLKGPIEFNLMSNRTGLEKDDIIRVLEKLPPDMVSYNDDSMQLTKFGFNFYNDIVAAFM
jgi:putative oxygen-independent coproporphyrinogen III oxidase